MKSTKFYTSFDDLPIIMDLPMVAILVGLSLDRLRTLAREGKFPAWKLSENQWRVCKDDLLAWINERKRA